MGISDNIGMERNAIEGKDMTQSYVLEGTWEEIKLHDEELSGKRFRLVSLSSEPAKPLSNSSNGNKTKSSTAQEANIQASRQLTGMGKFAGILPSSEEFMRQKQEEIELEERKFHE